MTSFPNRYLCFEVTVPQPNEEVGYALLDKLTQMPIARSLDTDDSKVKLIIYYSPTKKTGSLAKCFKSSFPGKCSIRTFLLDDWKDRWKKSFRPKKISPHLWICPSWQTLPYQQGQKVIRLDPGLAFGTGQHPTTQFVLKAIDRHAGNIQSLLDIGTGSGVLAIGAALLGIPKITAIDFDKNAIQVAAENFKKNHCSWVQLKKTSLEDFPLTRKYDFLAANLETRIHLRSKTRYLKLLAKGGRIALTGVHTKWRSEVMDHYRSSKLTLESRFRGKEWSGFCFRKV